MSFAKIKIGMWLVFTWFTVQTYGFTQLSICTFLYLFLFRKFIKKNYTRSFLRFF